MVKIFEVVAKITKYGKKMNLQGKNSLRRRRILMSFP